MNRRQFLQRSALVGTFTLLSPLARAVGSNSQIRCAVVGLHGRGKNLLAELLRATNARLVALCDCDQDVLDQAKADMEKQQLSVATYRDYRKLCAAKDIDAIIIATPNHTHAVIALTAAAQGKHVYLEKPVSHNIWEGRQLAIGAQKHKVIIQHGFQRRSETCWEDAFSWLKEGHIGKLVFARGFCYKPRPSIGKSLSPLSLPSSIDQDLWFGPREITPVMRKQFHYNWHWQSPYGNGDLGNQGPHQLDVCRWALGDPVLPESIISIGGRLGYEDDGNTANTQLLFLEHKGLAPILFEVRGLPKSAMDYKKGMDRFQGIDLGNAIEYENGSLLGGHGANCKIVDKQGKIIKSFKGGRSHIQSFIDAVIAGQISPTRAVESAHYSSALAHLGAISLAIQDPAQRANIGSHPEMSDAYQRLEKHLEANHVDLKKTPLTFGSKLQFDPKTERFIGTHADKANPLLTETYRKGFTLPIEA
jgi:predicted dehydrogenase